MGLLAIFSYKNACYTATLQGTAKLNFDLAETGYIKRDAQLFTLSQAKKYERTLPIILAPNFVTFRTELTQANFALCYEIDSNFKGALWITFEEQK